MTEDRETKRSIWTRPIGEFSAPPDSRADRIAIWNTAIQTGPPSPVLILEKCFFPGAEKPKLALVAQANFTDAGVFLVGLAELDVANIESIDSDLVAYGMGGVLGGWFFKRQQKGRVKAIIKHMEQEYEKGVKNLEYAPLGIRVVEAPKTVHHFSAHEISGISWTKEDRKPNIIETVFGAIELPADLADETKEQLNGWWNCIQTKRRQVQCANWTRQKVLLYCRTGNSLDDLGLVPYLCAVGNNRDLTEKHAHLLASGMGLGLGEQFWEVVEKLYNSNTKSGRFFAARAAIARRRMSWDKLAIAVLSALAGAALATFMGWIIPKGAAAGNKGNNRDVLLIMIIFLAGVVGVLFGIVQFFRGLGDFRRSQKYVRDGREDHGHQQLL